MDPIEQLLTPIKERAVPATYVVSVAVIFLEFVLLRALGHRVSHRGGATSLFSAAGSFGLHAVAGRLFYSGLMIWIYEHRLFDLGAGPLAWGVAFLLYDLSFYVGHRAGHEIRWIWCFHSVHHTTVEMRLTTGVRGSFFDFVYLPWFFVWIPVVGIHPLLLLSVEAGCRIWGVLTHVSPRLIGRLGPLEGVLITPSAHRVHHGSDLPYLDRNYGEVLALWDRLFGTWQVEIHPPTFGLTRPHRHNDLWWIQLSPWADLLRDLRRSPSLGVAMAYLWRPPGWSHDGEDNTVATLQARAAGSPLG